MKLIKLTDVCCGDTLYINSNCILSCEHKYHHESETWYTKVGLLYENAFEFWYVKETIEEIQSQLEGKTNDNNQVGQRIKAIRLEKGMTTKEFGAFIGATDSNFTSWQKRRTSPNHQRIKIIADLAGMIVQKLLEG